MRLLENVLSEVVDRVDWRDLRDFDKALGQHRHDVFHQVFSALFVFDLREFFDVLANGRESLIGKSEQSGLVAFFLLHRGRVGDFFLFDFVVLELFEVVLSVAVEFLKWRQIVERPSVSFDVDSESLE